LKFFSRVWTPPNDLDAIDELMTEDYAITSGGKDIIGREEFQTHLLEATTESLEVFANDADDRVVSR